MLLNNSCGVVFLSLVPYRPEVCVWEITLKCNMRCTHCGSRAGKARENELTLGECFVVANDLIDLGVMHTSFIGGEVFLYEGWEKIARMLAMSGIYVNIVTNGYLMGDKQINEIRYAGLGNVVVSLDGMEQKHNEIRGVKDSFKKSMQTLDKLNVEGISTGVITSLVDANVDQLEPLYDLLVSKGVEVWQIQTVTPMGNMADKKNMLINPLKMPIITKFVREKRAEGKIDVRGADNVGYFDENELFLRGENNEWAGCNAGLKVIGIDSIGNVKGCESLYSDEFIEGNIRTESIVDIWNKEGNFAYNRNFDVSMLTGNCKDCNKGVICRGGCRGSCYFTTTSKFENPYCQFNR